jgi:predicted HTH domain antitoxin
MLIIMGRSPDRNELQEDAIRALLGATPDLKKDMAVELYKRGEVSLSRAAEIYGSNIEDFKKVLKERGIKREIPCLSMEEIDKEAERILLL